MASEHRFSSDCLAVCTQTLGAYYDSLISFTLSPRYSTFVSCNKYIYMFNLVQARQKLARPSCRRPT
jgi:hypothetical protein